MDTLQIAYKILRSLEDKTKADYMGQIISPTALGVSEDKWLEVIQSLLDEGYIAGVKLSKDILGNQLVDVKNARITLKGAIPERKQGYEEVRKGSYRHYHYHQAVRCLWSNSSTVKHGSAVPGAGRRYTR